MQGPAAPAKEGITGSAAQAALPRTNCRPPPCHRMLHPRPTPS